MYRNYRGLGKFSEESLHEEIESLKHGKRTSKFWERFNSTWETSMIFDDLKVHVQDLCQVWELRASAAS